MTLFSKNKFYAQFEIILDSALIALAFFVSYYLRVYMENVLPLPPLQELSMYSWIFFFLVVLWPLVMYVNGKYRIHIAKSFQMRFFITVKAAAYSLFGFVSALFLLKLYYINRSFVVFFVLCALVAVSIKDALLDYYFKKHLIPQVILAGRYASCLGLWKNITMRVFPPLDIKGVVTSVHDEGRKEQELPILGPASRFRSILHHVSPDAVFLNLEENFLREADEIVRICEEEGIEVWTAADMLHMMLTQMDLVKLGDYHVLIFTPFVYDKPWQLFFKRIFDVVASSCLLIACAPLFLLVAIAIKLDSPGAVFFRQKRMGAKGRKFIMYKFRSMTTDADQRKSELKKLNVMKGPAFKVMNDPRITRAGKWLRRLSIDELPQLWNILIGEMSLVGPRPTPVAESVRYKGWQRKRFSMKPGLTCLWQVRGRNEITDLDEWMNLDLAYVNSWSLWLDFKILLETIPIVLTGKGAA